MSSHFEGATTLLQIEEARAQQVPKQRQPPGRRQLKRITHKPRRQLVETVTVPPTVNVRIESAMDALGQYLVIESAVSNPHVKRATSIHRDARTGKGFPKNSLFAQKSRLYSLSQDPMHESTYL
jgi:hypothetical protein